MRISDGHEAGFHKTGMFADVRWGFRAEVSDYVGPRMERVDENFRFPEKCVAVEDRRNERLAQHEFSRLRVDGKRRSGRAFQHVLRLEKGHAQLFPASRRRVPEISGKDDLPAFGNVVDGEMAAVDLEEIGSVRVAAERHAQTLPEIFYESETVHFPVVGVRPFCGRRRIGASPVRRKCGNEKTSGSIPNSAGSRFGGFAFSGAGAAVFSGMIFLFILLAFQNPEEYHSPRFP